MTDVMQHVETLAGEIGPRPATSDAEKRAAAYIESAFAERGIETELQEFSAPRTYSWAYVIYNLVTVLAAVGAGLLGGKFAWAFFAVAAIDAFFLAMDLDTRFGLSKIMPKRPSQNVIARHIPKARRGDRLRRVIVVAHYDSARSSLAFAPGMVRQFGLTFGAMKVVSFAIPVFVLLIALPQTAFVEPYLWYFAMVVAILGLIGPIVINIHRELFMKHVDGAGDNASGVAAMLSVMEALVPEGESRMSTGTFAPVRRGPEAAAEADVVPEGALLSYSPAGSSDAAVMDLPDDFTWADVSPEAEPSRNQRSFEFETGELEPVQNVPGRVGGVEFADDEPLEAGDMATDAVPARRGVLGRRGAKRTEKKQPRRGRAEDASPSDWLGVDDSFDAREEGGKIGSWDQFGGDDDDDDIGWKGGWAGDDPIEDDDFSANEAARIRRRVTETVDRDLSEKEVWFVATGAEEVGTVGMEAFLRAYGEEIRDAFIINIDNVGAGNLCWITEEGMLRGYRVDRRLTGLAKRVSRENDILVKPHTYRLLSTDATPALARGFKAMSIMAFDDGHLANWHWETDTVDNVDPTVVETAADFVTKMIREI